MAVELLVIPLAISCSVFCLVGLKLFMERPRLDNATVSAISGYAEEEARKVAREARQKEEAACRRTEEVRQKAEDARHRAEEALNRAKVMEAKAAEAIREKEQLEKKAKDALYDLNHGIQPVVWPTAEELVASKARADYREDRLHFAVCSASGSGKSSLINALRGLKNS